MPLSSPPPRRLGGGGSVLFVWVARLLERRMAVVCTAGAALICVEGAAEIYMGGAAVTRMGGVAVILHDMRGAAVIFVWQERQ